MCDILYTIVYTSWLRVVTVLRDVIVWPCLLSCCNCCRSDDNDDNDDDDDDDNVCFTIVDNILLF